MLLSECGHVLHDGIKVRIDGVVGRRGRQIGGEIPCPEDEKTDDVQDGDGGPHLLLVVGHFDC